MDKIRDDLHVLEKYEPIGFLNEKVEIPHRTIDHVSETIKAIITSSKKNLIESNFELFSEGFKQKYEFINNPRGIFRKTLKQSMNFAIEFNTSKAPNIDMKQIEESDSLLVPSIYIKRNAIKVTINEIRINVQNLLFGVDVTPLQIRLCNYTNKDIICEFNQNTKELPLPSYRNESGYVIIEIQVESICKKILEQKKEKMKKGLTDIESLFEFEGVFSLSTSDNLRSKAQIKYSISLQYVTLTSFIQITNNHRFAIKDEVAKIVPFIAGPKTKISFEKFTNRYIPSIDKANSIQELNDNKALKPNFQNSKNKEDNRICNIESSFAESNSDTSFLSMNYEFGLSKENVIPVEIKIDTFPSNNNLYLSVFSDNENEFKESNCVVTIGNIHRKVYFFIGYLNIGNEPISPSSIELNSENYHVQTKFNELDKMDKIQPNKYGYIISFFEVRYCGAFQKELNMINATLTVKIGEVSKTIDFMYKVNLLKIEDNEHFYNEKSSIKYFNIGVFKIGDIKELDEVFWKMENQIIVSPYSYVFHNKNNKFPSVEYNIKKGAFIEFTNKSGDRLEVLEITSKNKFVIKAYENADSFYLDGSNIQLFGRLEDKPETFFPLFCPNDKIDIYFDARKCTRNNVEENFNRFYMSLFDSNEKKGIGGSFDILFNRSPSTSNNFSILVNYLGKNFNILNFNKLIHQVKVFTNSSIFEDTYYASIKNLTDNREEFLDDHKYQFFSYISALNEISLDRYEDLQTSNFYLTLPIGFESIKLQQNIMLSRIMNEKEISNCKYVNNFKQQTKEENEFEENNIKDFEKNGYKVTSILKWSQSKGLEQSSTNELEKYKKKQISLVCDIETDKIHDFSTDSLNKNESINLPKNVTLITLYELFDKICSLTSMLPFTLYSLIHNNSSLENVKNLISQILSIYIWQKDSAGCFPFSSFRAKFLPEFDAMMARLLNANVRFDNFSTRSFNDRNVENFVEIPSSLPVDIKISVFKQLGNQIIASRSSYEFNTEKNTKKEINEKKNEEITKSLMKEIKKASPKKIIINESKIVRTDEKAIPIIKNVTFEEINENTKEIPDTDFIKYLIEEMLQENINFIDPIEYKRSTTSCIPKSIQKINTIGVGNKRIDSFIEASMKLSNTLLKGINESNCIDDIMNNKDTIYSSILVDCSSTFSISQKAALVTLAMALGNSLTAIKIPYSIIIFCESNFQFILKQVDESHDLIHFEKLLDTITIRRRMSDMSSAILMADEQIKTKDKNRTNHSMFVLTDGLTPKIRLIDQWKRKVLNNNRRSVMFCFLDVLTKENDKNLIHLLWSNFANNIKDSISINDVIYTKASSIYNGDSIFIDPFINVLSNFIGEYETDKQIIVPKTANPIDKIPDGFLDSIIDYICKATIAESSIYAQYSFPNDVLKKFTDTDLNLNQPSPLTSFSGGIGDIDIELINDFLQKLISASHSLFDNSILQDISALVFPPNKPSQYTPSENGNIFYFPGLMKFILTQGQDSKIFLEKKAGFIKSYSVFVVIDNSISCFNNATYTHSFQTILSLLYPLSKIDIPSLNIIITTSEGPVILCSEKPSMIALDEKSPLWISLFSNLFKPHSIHSHFYAALASVYQMRIQQKSQSSILFTLTDGCYEFDERNELNSIFNALKATNMIPITIGIGMNPKFIDLLTDKAIWSQNTKLIWNAILFLFDKDTKLCKEVKTCFSYSQFTNEKAMNLENNLLLNKIFPELYDELNKVVRKAATYKNFYNKDNSKLINESNEIIVQNPVGAEYDLGKKDHYKGVKILIVMCWDYTCSDVEDHRISEEVLRNGVDGNNISVVNALNYYGIHVNIVKNYKDAINELIKGIYSQVWIICGRMDGSMPGNNNTSNNYANLIDQFIDCVIMYWSIGGGIAFWTDNYPLTAEVNKFLEKASFDVKMPSSNRFVKKKVNFHIGGDDQGQKMLARKDKLVNCAFEGNVAITSEGYEKELFNHGLNKIFEGITIASAINGREQEDEWKNYKSMSLTYANDSDIYPFKAFSKSSSGGYSSLYYMSPLDSSNGDIVIDCGFSKLFFELTEEGIDRYVKNIAVWLLQLEKKDYKYGSTKDARFVVPPKFDFKISNIPNAISFHKFNIMKDIDLVFLVDGTGSMRFHVEAVRDCCNEIASQCNKKFPGREFRFGSVIYRDTIVTERNPAIKRKDEVDICLLTNQPDEIHQFFANLKTYGGGSDGPEDWVSGYDNLLHKINWKENSVKIVIHICDAEGHGTSFTCDPKYSGIYYKVPKFGDKHSIEEDDEVYNEIQNLQDMQFKILVQEAARKGLIFFCLNNHKKSLYCFKQTRDLYLINGGLKFVIQDNFTNFNFKNPNKNIKIIDDKKAMKDDSNSVTDTDTDTDSDDFDDDDNDYDDNSENDDDSENGTNDKDDNDARIRRQLIEQVKTIVMGAVDTAVAVSQKSGIGEYERKCNEEFENDFLEQERFVQELFAKKRIKLKYLRNTFGRGRRGRRGGRGGRRGRSGRRGRGK